MSTLKPTWEPIEEPGYGTTRGNLPETVFAFPKQRKEPMTDAQHVRNAVARFDQVVDVSDEDRALAFANIEKAARIGIGSRLQPRPQKPESCTAMKLLGERREVTKLLVSVQADFRQRTLTPRGGECPSRESKS